MSRELTHEEAEAAEILGKIIKNGRALLAEKRGSFAHRVGVTRDVIVCLEHADPPQARRHIRNMINKADLSAEDKNRAYQQLLIICPRRWQQRKIHLPVSILRPRNIRR